MITAFVDIETTPLEFQEREISSYLMDKSIPRFNHPFFAKIIVIGIKKENEEPKLFYSNDEKEILTRFWQFVSEEKIDKIVTWNGYRFDIPFMNLRSIINGIKKTKNINLTKWKMLESNHIDCMRFFSADGEFQFIALEIACRLMDIPVAEDRIRGDDIEKLFRKGNWEAIVKKAEEDLVMLEELYKKIKPFMV